MHTSSSAKRTCSDSRSASEYTATVCTPSSRHARITRSAISPRLAMRTFLNTGAPWATAGVAHQWAASLWRGDGAVPPVMSEKVRSDAESMPEARSANSLGLLA